MFRKKDEEIFKIEDNNTILKRKRIKKDTDLYRSENRSIFKMDEE